MENMNFLKSYAHYFNLLYQDKNYGKDVDFTVQLLRTFAPSTKSILDLGCGTGAHAYLLAEQGFEVYGIDSSADMILQANKRQSEGLPELSNRLAFEQGDLRSLKLEQSYDAVISIFHVMSYQTTNDDLLAAFESAKMHLNPGGIFIFDFWYGPAVLSERPASRLKRLEDEHIEVIRLAEPKHYPNKNLVDVRYQMFIKDKHQETLEEFAESHPMRYLFKPEIELMLSLSQMQLVDCREWISQREPGVETWSVYCVAKV
jgi:SAM-dependent methyltransferase